VNENGNLMLKVDSTTNAPGNRNSVRISSQKSFEKGQLLLMDALHAPACCGCWPAFWTVGTNWPENGEIDIQEGVNLQTTNQMTLHTSSGCEIGQPMQGTGKVLGSNCDVSATGNAGCGISDPRQNSFGKGFNDNNGGVFATLWDDFGIKIWFFPRGSVPDDITAHSPDPSNWSEATASFSNDGCNTSQFFGSQTIIFDLTLFGDWAGAVYGDSGCPGNPESQIAKGSNFDEAFYEVAYVAVFSGNGT